MKGSEVIVELEGIYSKIFGDQQSSKEVIDRAEIDDLLEYLPPEEFIELIDEYLLEYKRLMKEINLNLLRKDAELLRKDFHSLRGQTGNFRAPLISEFLYVLELLAKDGEIEKIQKSIEPMKKVMEKFLVALKKIREDYSKL